MPAIIKYLIMGSFLGLTAGISPGPLITLVIAQTLKHGKKEGIKIAVSPLFTDLPIITFTLLIFTRLAQSGTLLGIIAFLGGIFVAYLGFETIQTKGILLNKQNANSRSLRKGITANFLSPYPYLFWMTIGSPLLLQAYSISLIAVISFLLSFYTLMVGSKILVALLVSKSQTLIGNKYYIFIMRLLGLILFFFAAKFIYDGIQILQILK
jgi:threonine/homoserine/homoserine lactone efflux protein